MENSSCSTAQLKRYSFLDSFKNMQLIKLYKSDRPNKKFKVHLFKNGRVRTIHFGDKRYEDYTVHHDRDRRERYRVRHSSDRIDNPEYPGYWSWWVLWGPSVNAEANMEAIRRQHWARAMLRDYALHRL